MCDIFWIVKNRSQSSVDFDYQSDALVLVHVQPLSCLLTLQGATVCRSRDPKDAARLSWRGLPANDDTKRYR